jgi:hypothetical protein
LMDGKSPWMASSLIFTTLSALIQVSLQQSWNSFLKNDWVAMSQNWVDPESWSYLTMCAHPPVISWFISPSNYSYKYHKP